jgi:hypothetical protein
MFLWNYFWLQSVLKFIDTVVWVCVILPGEGLNRKTDLPQRRWSSSRRLSSDWTTSAQLHIHVNLKNQSTSFWPYTFSWCIDICSASLETSREWYSEHNLELLIDVYLMPAHSWINCQCCPSLPQGAAIGRSNSVSFVKPYFKVIFHG